MDLLAGFKTKEELQEHIANLEKEIDLLNTKLEKETSDNELLKKQLNTGQNFDMDKLHELENYKTKMKKYYSKMIFYERIVERYREMIEQGETLSIPELKSKIDPDLELIQKKIKGFGDGNTSKALELAKEYVDGITTVDNIKIDFWITPEDVATYNVADPSCKAILLASFASALEYDYKVLICQMSNGEKRHLVMVDLNSKSLLLDPNKKHNFFKYHGESSSLIADYELNDAKISKVLYEFDEREYITHEE